MRAGSGIIHNKYYEMTLLRYGEHEIIGTALGLNRDRRAKPNIYGSGSVQLVNEFG